MTIKNIERGPDGLPVATEKELAAMDRLLSSAKYKIKEPVGFLHTNKKGLVSFDFIMHTLNDFLWHVQAFVSAAKKMIPTIQPELFFDAVKSKNPAAAEILKMALAVDLKTLSQMLSSLQASAMSVSIAVMQPFVKTLYKSLIRIYYLKPDYASECIRDIYRVAADHKIPSNMQKFQSDTMTALEELQYIYSKVFPSMYPLVLRMASPLMLNEHDLFYKNGSKVLAWLEVAPEEIIFPASVPLEQDELPPEHQESNQKEKGSEIPEGVYDGLEALERLFPEAGWKKMLDFPEAKVDFAPYFAELLQVSDTFIQLNPAHPLQFTMILFHILSELLQGLRQVDFKVPSSEEDSIYIIIDDWIMYKVSVFDKDFGDDLNSYMHQIYSQPDFAKTPYATRLMSNMYSIIRRYFLPFYDTHFYVIRKMPKDGLPPLFQRVARLREMLEEYVYAVTHGRSFSWSQENKNASPEDRASDISKIYRFEIPNSVSRRLDALCGGKNSRKRTNAVLISYCISLLSVLDWWINDANSPAYKTHTQLLYRTLEEGSMIPVFGVTPRKDTAKIFKNSLRQVSEPESAET